MASTAEIILQCMLDPENDPNRNPNCDCLLSGGGPQMNTDISGIGVRISFYLQALFLALLSARSGSLDEISGALYTLIATNIAMAVTSLILGFKPSPEISFHDAIVVFYLLTLAWASVFSSLPSYNRYVKADPTVKYFAIVQSYVVFALALAIVIRAPTFGTTPLCNKNARAVFFRPFSALHGGRIAAAVILTIVIISYTCLTATDYMPGVKKWYEKKTAACRNRANTRTRDITDELSQTEAGVVSTIRKESYPLDSPSMNEKQGEQNKKHKKRRQPDVDSNKYDVGISGKIVIEILVILVLWALMVMNTELVIRWNNFEDGSGGDSWQFGQILPMFLIVLPLVNMIKAFKEHKLDRHTHKRRVHRKPGAHAHGPAAAGGMDDAGGGFGGLGGGGGFGPGMFPSFMFGGGAATPRPNGNLPTARISEHSIHDSECPRPDSRASTASESESVSSSSSAKTNNDIQDDDLEDSYVDNTEKGD